MRKSALRGLILFLPGLVLGFGLLGCGGGGSDPGSVLGPPAKVTLSPSTLSLERGQVAGVSVLVQDANDNPLFSETVTFNSSNTSVVTVSNNGLVCAGTWDSLTTPVVCTPAAAAGTANLTATAGSITSAATPVFVHDKVTNIVVTPGAIDCLSQDDTQQFTAQAFNGGTDITATVGPFTWSSTFSNLVSIDTDGLATAELPGRSSIVASISGTNSTPASFMVCPPASITVHVKDLPDTTFSVATGATVDVVADVVDTMGKTLTGVPVEWRSSLPAVATVNSTGLVRGVAPGTTTISATCSPPACNANTTLATYGSVAVATVTGTAVATTAYATCTSTTAPCTTAVTNGTQTPLVPINTSNNTASTALQLPNTPNSLIFSGDGLVALLGSAGGLMSVTTNNNALESTVSNAPGKVLATNEDGQRAIISDVATSTVFILDRTANTLQVLSIAGATAGAFTPDGFKAFIVAGNALYVFSTQLTLRSVALGAAATDVAILSGGPFAYLAGGAASSVTAHATCDNSLVETLGTPGTPSLVKSLPDGKTLLAADSPGIDVVSVVPDFTSGCPPTLADTVTSIDFGQGAFIARQMIVLPDGSRAYITSDLASVLVYDVAGGTTTTIPLAGGAVPTTGGATVDSTSVFVGGSDNAVHRIDVATDTDTAQIPLSFTPDLVGVKSR